MHSDLIITAASQPYADSLLALVGSLNVNWPGHPPILVYDIGMSAESVEVLNAVGIEVRKVPEFCPHWQRHFTWKIWSILDAPADRVLWLDAGICVLRPLNEAFVAIEALGYFCPTNGWSLKSGVCDALRKEFSLNDEALDELLSATGGIFGLNKCGVGQVLIEEAMRLALVEDHMQATQPLHRHDQALLSLLLHRYFSPVLFADHLVYAGWQSAQQFAVQKIWVHRRSMRSEDLNYFKQYLGAPGPQHIPLPPGTSSVQRAGKQVLGTLFQHLSAIFYKVPDGIKR